MNNPVMIADDIPAENKTEVMRVGLPELRVESLRMPLKRKPVLCHLLALELRKDSVYGNIITDEFVRNIYHASSLLDVENMEASDDILLNLEEQDPDGLDVMKKHVDIERRALRKVLRGYQYTDFAKFCMELSMYHHEKWDGTGHPDGLYGLDIPLPARIMSLVDAYESLRSKQSGIEALSHEKCVQIIKEGGGVRFDPSIVKGFSRMESKFADIYDAFREDTPPICKA